MGQEARLLGHGGVRAVARAAGVSETTVRAGVFELEAGEDPLPEGRVRRPGGGRKRAEDLDPGLVPALLALVEPEERGDPASPLRWTVKSLRNLAGELTRQGHPVSAPTVGRLLREQGFSLQANVKTLEGKQHPDRDAQFRYINEQVRRHQAAGQPVISVDAKKKEQLGQLPNPGRAWRPEATRCRWRITASTSPARHRGGHPVRHLRPGPRRRLGERRHRSRHLGVRGGVDPPLVGRARPDRLPGGRPAADHRGLRGLQQLPLPGLEGRTGGVRRRDGADGHGLPLPAGHLQVEQDRAPAVFPHHDELARQAPDQPPGRGEQHRRHAHPHRAARDSRAGHRKLPGGELDQPRTAGRAADPPARAPRHLELHHRAGQRRRGCPAGTRQPGTVQSTGPGDARRPPADRDDRRRTRHAGPPAGTAAGRPGRTAQVPPARRSPPQGQGRPLPAAAVRRRPRPDHRDLPAAGLLAEGPGRTAPDQSHLDRAGHQPRPAGCSANSGSPSPKPPCCSGNRSSCGTGWTTAQPPPGCAPAASCPIPA